MCSQCCLTTACSGVQWRAETITACQGSPLKSGQPTRCVATCQPGFCADIEYSSFIIIRARSVASWLVQLLTPGSVEQHSLEPGGGALLEGVGEAEGGGDGFLVRGATREIPEREVAGEDMGLGWCVSVCVWGGGGDGGGRRVCQYGAYSTTTGYLLWQLEIHSTVFPSPRSGCTLERRPEWLSGSQHWTPALHPRVLIAGEGVKVSGSTRHTRQHSNRAYLPLQRIGRCRPHDSGDLRPAEAGGISR